MAPKKKQIEEALRELADAHTEFIQQKKRYLGNGGDLEIVLTKFDKNIRELEVEITATAKALFNRGEALNSSNSGSELTAKF